MKDAEEDKLFEDIMTRAYTAMAFREFYKHNLTQLKYEMKTSNARILHYNSSRGLQRLCEKKKYKTLGEMCSLSLLLEKLKENQVFMVTETSTRHQEQNKEIKKKASQDL